MVSLAPDGADGLIGADCPSDFACDVTADRETAEGLRSDNGGTTADVVVKEPAGSALLAGEGAEDLGFDGADAG